MEKVTAVSYTLKNDDGTWLGQRVLTSDGMFSAVTDWGNFAYAWRHTGMDSFTNFLIGLNVDYFANKMASGMSYVVYTKKVEKSCLRFAEKILPVLQEKLK